MNNKHFKEPITLDIDVADFAMESDFSKLILEPLGIKSDTKRVFLTVSSVDEFNEETWSRK
jgi:hypothetical protein